MRRRTNTPKLRRAISKRKPFRFFTPQQAADYEAFASQIIPTDETPGAKEANVVRFVDFALSEIEPQNKQDFAKALEALNAQAKKTAPEAAVFRCAHFSAASRSHEGDREDPTTSAP